MYSEQQMGVIRNNERNNFKILKQKENSNRCISISEDILNTKDFVFEKYPHSGDSGQLLLARNKLDKQNKYIIKHEYYDCACNEYIYSKIGNQMGISIAPVKMFLITDKFKIFKSDFVCGVQYFEDCIHVGYKDIIENKNDIKNWRDYFKYYGLESLFFESDGIEVIKNNEFIYRIDTAASFSLNNIDISYLAYDFEYKDINVKEFAEKNMISKAEANYNRLSFWKSDMDFFIKKFDREYIDYYLEPFYSILKISENKIKEWTSIVNYFYPNIIGEYFLLYFKNLKEDVKQFLESIIKNTEYCKK